jgi:hypothetical protein
MCGADQRSTARHAGASCWTLERLGYSGRTRGWVYEQVAILHIPRRLAQVREAEQETGWKPAMGYAQFRVCKAVVI